ncbi:MAG: hypothetical protein WC489_06095 [Patescibacteria group bacterium]|jgi:hypothetical protein
MAGNEPKRRTATITFRPGPGHRDILAKIIERVDSVSNPSDACRHVIDLAAEYYDIKVFYDKDGKPIKQKEEGEQHGRAIP